MPKLFNHAKNALSNKVNKSFEHLFETIGKVDEKLKKKLYSDEKREVLNAFEQLVGRTRNHLLYYV